MAPKTKSVIRKPRKTSFEASMAKLQAAARARREAREACEAQQAAAGPSDAGPSEVKCTGEQSWEERDAMLRAEAVEVDADGEGP